MADDRETAAELLEHRSRHLARVGSDVVFGNVLRAPSDLTARKSERDLRKIWEGCAHRVIETLCLLKSRLERLQQPCIRDEAAVHLPVTCYEPRAQSHSGGAERVRFYRRIAARVNRKRRKIQDLADVPGLDLPPDETRSGSAIIL